MKHNTLFFAGIDWGRKNHQVCLIDQNGSVLAQKSFAHLAEGFYEMAEWMLEVSGSTTNHIGVSIENNRGAVVETLMGLGFRVYSINPKQLDRFRDRFSPSGAKDDRRDARVLAEALRTDGRYFREVTAPYPDIADLRRLTREREELMGERVALINRIRGDLWEYYPQFEQVIGNGSLKLWHIELWELAPTPGDAKKTRPSTVQKLLKRNRVRRIDGKEAIKILRSKEIELAEGTVPGIVRRVRRRVERLKLVDRQLKEIEIFIDDRIKALDSRLRSESEKEGRPSDIEILRSIPGVGRIVLAVFVSEASDILSRRDYRALRCFAGVAPVTKQSGKSRQVVRRHASCRRLMTAVSQMAKVAVMHDSVSKAGYESLRARGLGYHRTLRTVGDRLLHVGCALLKKGEVFDKEYGKVRGKAAA